MSDALAVVSVSLDASANAPGRRVGDIAGSAVAEAWEAVARFLPPDESAGVRAWMRDGEDLGRIAARALVELTGGEMAVIDGREPVLRHAARDTLLAFFDQEEELRRLVRAGGEVLVADGYHAQLDTGSDSGLFWVQNGTRQRIPEEARVSAREAFARDVMASPGVVARNLMQDAVLARWPWCWARPRSRIAPSWPAVRRPPGRVPVVFPRLAATFVPPAVRDACAASRSTPRCSPPTRRAGSRVSRLRRSPRAATASRTFPRAFRTQAERFVVDAGRAPRSARAGEARTTCGRVGQSCGRRGTGRGRAGRSGRCVASGRGSRRGGIVRARTATLGALLSMLVPARSTGAMRAAWCTGRRRQCATR